MTQHGTGDEYRDASCVDCVVHAEVNGREVAVARPVMLRFLRCERGDEYRSFVQRQIIRDIVKKAIEEDGMLTSFTLLKYDFPSGGAQ